VVSANISGLGASVKTAVAVVSANISGL